MAINLLQTYKVPEAFSILMEIMVNRVINRPKRLLVGLLNRSSGCTNEQKIIAQLVRNAHRL